MYFPLDEVLMGWIAVSDYDEKEKEEKDYEYYV
jgi:hypothetical protein